MSTELLPLTEAAGFVCARSPLPPADGPAAAAAFAARVAGGRRKAAAFLFGRGGRQTAAFRMHRPHVPPGLTEHTRVGQITVGTRLLAKRRFDRGLTEALLGPDADDASLDIPRDLFLGFGPGEGLQSGLRMTFTSAPVPVVPDVGPFVDARLEALKGFEAADVGPELLEAAAERLGHADALAEVRAGRAKPAPPFVCGGFLPESKPEHSKVIGERIPHDWAAGVDRFRALWELAETVREPLVVQVALQGNAAAASRAAVRLPPAGGAWSYWQLTGCEVSADLDPLDRPADLGDAGAVVFPLFDLGRRQETKLSVSAVHGPGESFLEWQATDGGGLLRRRADELGVAPQFWDGPPEGRWGLPHG